MSVRLLLFPERDTADDAPWGVLEREEMVADESGPVEGGLRERFRALAEERGGWYDPEPSGP